MFVMGFLGIFDGFWAFFRVFGIFLGGVQVFGFLRVFEDFGTSGTSEIESS